MKPLTVVLVEAAIVGVLLIIFAFIAQYIVALGWPMKSMPAICSSWNDTHVMEATLFVAGALFHLAFEYTGINKKYAQDYVANH